MSSASVEHVVDRRAVVGDRGVRALAVDRGSSPRRRTSACRRGRSRRRRPCPVHSGIAEQVRVRRLDVLDAGVEVELLHHRHRVGRCPTRPCARSAVRCARTCRARARRSPSSASLLGEAADVVVDAEDLLEQSIPARRRSRAPRRTPRTSPPSCRRRSFPRVVTGTYPSLAARSALPIASDVDVGEAALRHADEHGHVAVGVLVLVHELVRFPDLVEREDVAEAGVDLAGDDELVERVAPARRWRSASPGGASGASRGSAGRRRRCSRWCRRRSRPCRRCRRRRSTSGSVSWPGCSKTMRGLLRSPSDVPERLAEGAARPSIHSSYAASSVQSGRRPQWSKSLRLM